MEVSTALLLRTPLFRGIPQGGAACAAGGPGRTEAPLWPGVKWSCGGGERADRLGLVLSGTLHIVKEDFWGSRTIVGLARSGEGVCGGLCLSGR